MSASDNHVPKALLSIREVGALLDISTNSARKHRDLVGLRAPGEAPALYDRYAVDGYLQKRLTGAARDQARRRLLRLAYGELQARGEARVELVETGRDRAPTSHLLDEEVWGIVIEGAHELGNETSSPTSFDAWAAKRGYPSSYAIRLRLAIWSWGRLLRHADVNLPAAVR